MNNHMRHHDGPRQLYDQRRHTSYVRPRVIGPTTVVESNGPLGKIRGTPVQLVERYMAQGRESLLTSDNTVAQDCFQYAEHYRRILQNCDPRYMAALPDADDEGDAPADEGEFGHGGYLTQGRRQHGGGGRPHNPQKNDRQDDRPGRENGHSREEEMDPEAQMMQPSRPSESHGAHERSRPRPRRQERGDEFQMIHQSRPSESHGAHERSRPRPRRQEPGEDVFFERDDEGRLPSSHMGASHAVPAHPEQGIGPRSEALLGFVEEASVEQKVTSAAAPRRIGRPRRTPEPEA